MQPEFPLECRREHIVKLACELAHFVVVEWLDKHAQALESAERRLSRHADHLANLEDRVKKLERGG